MVENVATVADQAVEYIEQVMVQIKPGRGTHTTSDEVLHRNGDSDPFLVDVSVYQNLQFKFDLCDPKTKAVLGETLPTVMTVKTVVEESTETVDSLKTKLASAIAKGDISSPKLHVPAKPIKKTVAKTVSAKG